MAKAKTKLARGIAAQVAELQERVDFAERLLAKQRDAERLPGKP